MSIGDPQYLAALSPVDLPTACERLRVRFEYAAGQPSLWIKQPERGWYFVTWSAAPVEELVPYDGSSIEPFVVEERGGEPFRVPRACLADALPAGQSGVHGVGVGGRVVRRRVPRRVGRGRGTPSMPGAAVGAARQGFRLVADSGRGQHGVPSHQRHLTAAQSGGRR